MEINEWWTADADERFWIEVTDRDDLGVDLFAPTVGDTGKPYWGYELVTRPADGDLVFHWHKSMLGEPALVGWSRASGLVEDTEIIWNSPAVGNTTANEDPRPAWRMPLYGFTMLPVPITMKDLANADDELKAIKAGLSASHVMPLYFPFALSPTQPPRPTQTYFTKFPRAVAELLGLDGFEFPAAPPEPGRKPQRSLGAGYMADTATRKAIEKRAERVAASWYRKQKYGVEFTGDKHPYDLVATRGRESRRVEVKGTSGEARSVMLTRAEVKNAREYQPTDLFVVEKIQYERTDIGEVRAFGGSSRRWSDWSPAEADLLVTEYRYDLPRDQTRTM